MTRFRPAMPVPPPPLTASGNMRLAVLPPERPTVMVVSHERSGTHFLMNSIARGYGYVSRPWIDLDHAQVNINYFAPEILRRTLAQFADQRAANLIKSHHAADFFDGILDEVLKKTAILYIHRDPVAVMLSFWRFIDHWPWREGPKRGDVLSFARAEPEGQMLRYQMKQRKNMLDRWARHVEGWTKAARGRHRLRFVRYDDLKNDYAGTLKSF
ncbi:MAG: sulfotransferase domain-containing protein, partial [Bauldia sp.]